MDNNFSRRFGVWDYVVTALVMLASVAIGLYHAFKRRKQNNANEYLMANRNMGTLPVALSVLATYFSATSLLGIPAEVYMFGGQYVLFAVSYFILIPATIYLYLPVFYDARVTSAYEYLELRFNSGIRKFASAIFVIQTVMFTAVVMYAPALALNQVTGLGVWVSVIIICTVCTAYTTIGGMRAVLWTDVFQICIMLISVLAVIIKGSIDLGGISEVWQHGNQGNRLDILNFEIDPTRRQTFWNLSFGGVFTWLAYYGVGQSFVQRYLTTKDIGTARKALWWNIIGTSGMTVLYFFGGLLIYAKYRNCDPLMSNTIRAADQLLPLFVMDTMGDYSGMSGLFVAAVFCAALSTMSSGLNSLAAVTVEDFIRPLVEKMSEKRAALLTKLIPLAYGALSFALVAAADCFGNLSQAAVSILGLVGGPVLGLFTLGMLVPWANSKGAVTGLFAGLGIIWWIAIGAQFHGVRSTPLPRSIDGCLANVTTVSTPLDITNTTYIETPIIPKSDVFVLYQISFLWFTAISCLTVLIIGTLASFVFGCNKSIEVKEELFFPPVRRLLHHFKTKAVADEQAIQNEKFTGLPENEALLMQVLSHEASNKPSGT